MNQPNTNSSQLNQSNLLFRRGFRPILASISAAIVALLLLAGNQFTAAAYPQMPVHLGVTAGPGGIAWVNPHTESDCSLFHIHGASYSGGGYAAVRLWMGGANGTPLIDSYVAGYPSLYFPIPNQLNIWDDVNFPAQPNGTTLTLRVYRAL